MSVRFESNNHIFFKFWNEAGQFLYDIMRGRPQDSIQEYWEEGNPIVGEDKYIADLVDKISKARSPNFPPFSGENLPPRPPPTDIIFTIDELKELKEKNEIIQRNLRYHSIKDRISDLVTLIEMKFRQNARKSKAISNVYEAMTGESGETQYGPGGLIHNYYGINLPRKFKRIKRGGRSKGSRRSIGSIHKTRKNRKSSRRNSTLRLKN